MYSELRDKAFQGTPQGLSLTLLAENPYLVYHAPVNPLGVKTHYTIYEENSAVCCTSEEAMILYALTKVIKPYIFIEIGSYAGWSSVHILNALSEDNLFIAVDNFSECNNTELVKKVLTSQLEKYPNSILFEEDSTKFLSLFHNLADMIFIDGFHRDGKPLEDVKAAIHAITKKGVIVLHDTWMTEVKAAHNYLIEQGFQHYTFKTDNHITVYCRQGLEWCQEFVW